MDQHIVYIYIHIYIYIYILYICCVYVALWFLVHLLSFAHIHLGVMSDIRCLVTVGRDQWMECRRIAALHAHLV